MTDIYESPESETRWRNSMRLRGFDYSSPGAYFITICTHQRRPLFGDVADGTMVLNEFGHVIEEEWFRLSERFPSVSVGEFVVMPDHFHGILWITASREVMSHNEDGPSNSDVEAGFTPASSGQPQGLPISGQPRGLPLGQAIGAYKSLCVKGCLTVAKNKNEMLGRVWQRNYYEHIIRDENELQKIILYIQSDPAKWETDRFYPPENLDMT